MTVRNYDKPAPARVVGNIHKVLLTKDLTLLEKDSYKFLITYCDYIAHYDYAGFIATWKDDMAGFVSQFLSTDGKGWDTRLNNPNSYIYGVSYKGKQLADIIRELVPIFTLFQPAIEAAQIERWHQEAEGHLRVLAACFGYDLVKKVVKGIK